ncbi:MAG: hypothetical protein EAZ24_12185 [Burkholderiales bacterium]|nr:MAG: hypothetical protein EAZ24_12185 [Burkholderiales bacterium]TAG80386.1 MAG: hypothetical protein EAZ21_08270 [Betaproteobacteria bacterium]
MGQACEKMIYLLEAIIAAGPSKTDVWRIFLLSENGFVHDNRAAARRALVNATLSRAIPATTPFTVHRLVNRY